MPSASEKSVRVACGSPPRGRSAYAVLGLTACPRHVARARVPRPSAAFAAGPAHAPLRGHHLLLANGFFGCALTDQNAEIALRGTTCPQHEQRNNTSHPTNA